MLNQLSDETPSDPDFILVYNQESFKENSTEITIFLYNLQQADLEVQTVPFCVTFRLYNIMQEQLQYYKSCSYIGRR